MPVGLAVALRAVVAKDVPIYAMGETVMLKYESLAKDIGAQLVTLVILLGPGFAWSQSNSENPQVNEGICDSLIGSSPSLYGLCLAFWAQGCEPDWSMENPFESCSAGSQTILDLYASRARPSDPPMPGIQAPCPCWSSEELAGLRYRSSEPYEYSFCLKDGSGTNFTNRDIWRIGKPNPDGGDYYSTFVATWINLTDAGSTHICAIRDRCDGNPGSCLDYEYLMPITAEQFLACEAQVASSALDRGLELEKGDCGHPQN
jgi:hypothetical protein